MGYTDGEGAPCGQQRGLQGEQPASLWQRRNERRDIGNLPGIVGGEAVEVVLIVDGTLGDCEGDD
jgi:hypothetical protein